MVTLPVELFLWKMAKEIRLFRRLPKFNRKCKIERIIVGDMLLFIINKI